MGTECLNEKTFLQLLVFGSGIHSAIEQRTRTPQAGRRSADRGQVSLGISFYWHAFF